jgi:cysteine desulfurase/selenocysteine lyase
MEHHANIVPWQMLAAQLGFEIRWIPLTSDGQLDLSGLDALIDGAKLLSVSAMSNVLGTINPIDRLANVAHQAGALICVDGCQLAPHSNVDVVATDIDFFAFSGHKMCGPTGIGALWARTELLEAMPPFLGGGEMIRDVRLDGFTPNEVPWKFEAGTPPIAEIVGFGLAADYLSAIGISRITEHEHRLTAYALRSLTERFGEDFTPHGPVEPNLRGGVMSFGFRDVHPHDLSQILDTHNVCVRAGHHCAKPLMRLMGIGATARASWYLYNDESDIDALADALAETSTVFF